MAPPPTQASPFPSPTASRPEPATIVTLSFRGDFDSCRLLCKSVDRFAPENFIHQLYVPPRDLALFAPLANGRRTVAAEDRDLLPGWMWKLPMPGPRLRGLLRLPRRNIYLSLFTPPVRGWIAQQIMKIAAAAQAPTDLVLHVDSDTLFIRPLTVNQLIRADGKARLYQSPKRVDEAGHRLWHETASRLLGLAPDPFHNGDYIDSLVLWRRSTARRLIARLEEIGGRDWRKILAATPHFSEYVLYGVFADNVLGLDAAGHWPDPHSLCHSLWTEQLQSKQEEQAFIKALSPDHVACLLQSTLRLSPDERGAFISRIVAEAARQDAPA
ncbi:MAG TPA: DUF6492 family protein [Rhodoblastus sp.]|nr:DUF6492 family protein [Rhodoblastus sp.]